MILDSTLISLQAVLAGAVAANQPEVTVDYIVWNTDGTQSKPATFRKKLNSTTDVIILPAPGVAGMVFEPRRVTIYNKDTSSIDVIVKTDDGTTEIIERRETVVTLKSLCWEITRGWY